MASLPADMPVAHVKIASADGAKFSIMAGADWADSALDSPWAEPTAGADRFTGCGGRQEYIVRFEFDAPLRPIILRFS
ncbi:MAG: hypothetical protein R2911_13705 [Caldilineaceae bacterium]